jgi:hypothetical protein
MMMSPRLEDGWLRLPYGGPELAQIEIGVGESEPTTWQPAFLNTVGDERVAQVRPVGFSAADQPKVWLRVNGVPVLIGRLGDQALRRDRRNGRNP